MMLFHLGQNIQNHFLIVCCSIGITIMDYQNNAQQQSCSKTDKTNNNINTDEIIAERNGSKNFLEDLA